MFDNARMCVVHECVGEKVIVKVSRFKKDVGFYRETVTKLKCNGGRTEGYTVPDIASVQSASDCSAKFDDFEFER